MNDPIILILVAVLPSIVVFLTSFHLIKQLMAGKATEQLVEVRRDDHKQILPLRLQAYERLTLFAERISPGALLLRVHKSHMSSGSFHGELVTTIREEFDHNVSQQIYVGDKVWSKVKQAKEETIRLINLSYEQTGEGRSGTDLSRRVFENVGKLSHTPSQECLMAIKEEVRRLF